MQGGSTLTQQLAKNLFLTQERTLSRKIQEAILALWLEHKYSKDQILELYLNRVYFGSGAYGVEAAAQKYFGKSARQVTLSEAAVLAGLMKSPTQLAPNRNLTAANERAAQVITAMARAGRHHRGDGQGRAFHARAGRAREGRGLDQLRRRLRHGHARRHRRRHRRGHRRHDDARSGDAGGRRAGADRGAQRQGRQIRRHARAPSWRSIPTARSRRWSAGATTPTASSTAPSRPSASPARPSSLSSISPALEKGLTPDTVREDAPITVKGWNPENYTREYFGPVTLTKALSLSLNTVAVRLGLEVGPKAVVRTAHRLGIASDLAAQRLDRAGHLGSHAAGTGRRLRRLRQRRHRRAAPRDRARAHRRRQAALHPQERQLRPGHRSAIRRDDERR